MGTLHRLTAVNTAFESENRIHADDIAAEYGFRGGLVPGVDVYAYLTWAPTEVWGRTWHERGSADLRLLAPCYDGDEIEVNITERSDDRVEATAHRIDGRRREPIASLMAGLDVERDLPEPTIAVAEVPAPDERRPAAADTLEPGRVLGTVHETVDPTTAAAYRSDVSEPHAELDHLAHPGWLLQGANDCLAMTVRLGPWMHVGSVVTNHRPIPIGSAVEWRSVVTDRYERKGHAFVENRVEVVVDGAVAQTIDHTSIYEPRRRR